MDFFRGADLLIFEAQYVFTDSVQMKRDWGHSSSYVGIDLALDAEVKKLLLFHHDPMKTDQVLLKIIFFTFGIWNQMSWRLICRMTVSIVDGWIKNLIVSILWICAVDTTGTLVESTQDYTVVTSTFVAISTGDTGILTSGCIL